MPYEQNTPQSVNDITKDWTTFLPQDMDRFIISLYDFMQSFDQEEELAYFQLSDKGGVCHQFQQHLRTESPTEMTPEEWKTLAKFVPIQKPTRGASILRSHHCPFPQLNPLQGSQVTISLTFQR